MARLPLREEAVAVWGYLRSEIGLGMAARGTLDALRLTLSKAIRRTFGHGSWTTPTRPKN